MRIVQSTVSSVSPTVWDIKVIGEDGYVIVGRACSQKEAEATRRRFEKEITKEPVKKERVKK